MEPARGTLVHAPKGWCTILEHVVSATGGAKEEAAMPMFCPGYTVSPFDSLAAEYPDEAAYPYADFRTEWGPIFHRGRLDGSARVLVIGQDPGQHENVLRRILCGEAGRRAQGFLAKLGITRSYVLINSLLYSVYGDKGAKYVSKPPVRDYRNRWIGAILAPGKIEAVVTFGAMAKKAWASYTDTNGVPSGVEVASLTHPTFPESKGGTKAEKAANTKKMLKEWNQALVTLGPKIAHPDQATTMSPYGDAFTEGDKADIPSSDLPAGIPSWMYDDDGWAARKGATAAEKRRTIVVTVPEGIIPG
jgi:uracil-DNA glycosylase